MAHGFISHKDLRKGGNDPLKQWDKMVGGIKSWMDLFDTPDSKSKAIEVGNQAAQLTGSNPKALLSGSRFANAGDGVQKSIGGDRGINPEHYGGALAKNIVNLSANRLKAEPRASEMTFDTTAQRVVDDEALFAKSASIAVGSNNEVVQAINVLTGVTRQLVQATTDQTAAQRAIAQIQHQQAEKLAQRAVAKSEENQIEQGYDNSWDVSSEPVGNPGRGGGGGLLGGGGGLLGTGMNLLGGARALKSVGRRGIGRMGTRALTRIGGRGLAKKFASKGAANTIKRFGVRQGAKLGIKNAGKGALKKGLGKALGKKIPLVGLGLGAIFAAQRAMAGDWTGAGLELASGAASTIPGLGTAASVGIDAALIGRDMGMTPFKDGGIASGPVNALIGEGGDNELVTPLNDETYLAFGQGIVDAQIKRKGDLTRAFDGGNKGLLSWFFGDKDKGNGDGNVNGGGGNNGLLPTMVSGVKNLFNRFFGNNNKKEETSLLNTIAHAEGNPGYNTWFGNQSYGGDLSGKTIDQMHDLQGQFLNAGLGRFGNGQNSAAVGRYQFTHLKEHANRMGVDTSTQMFTPEFQDQLALFLAAEKGVTPELLRSQGLSDDVINKLSPVWASFPGNQYGQPTKDNNVLRGIYNNKSNTDLDMSSIFSPGTNANDLALASASTSGGVNITNNYFSSGGEGGSGGSSGGATTLAMPFGISSSDTGTDVFQEMGLRSLA